VFHARIEFFLQDRIAISFAANYDLKVKTAAGTLWPTSATIEVMKLNKLSFEPALSIFFVTTQVLRIFHVFFVVAKLALPFWAE